MPKPMKDGLDEQAIRRIAEAMSAVDGHFPNEVFASESMKGIQALELRGRVDFLIERLASCLPVDFEAVADRFERIPEHWHAGEEGDPLRSFAAWPIVDYVGKHGLQRPERALALLKRLTPLFSAEFAIRPFLLRHTELTLHTLQQWCEDPNKHVRRLASEGARPRLPWGRRLKIFIEDPVPLLCLLERLKDDPSDYVRRSVANNLNDIAKDHPRLVVERCADWKRDAGADRGWVIRHATRTLVKQGYPGVYELLGLTEQPKLAIRAFTLNPNQLTVGDSLCMSFELVSTSREDQDLVVDYAVHHVKANGKTSPKIFKLKMLVLGAGETVQITKKHSLRPVTTRKYYAGRHRIEILVNGKPLEQGEFMLSRADTNP